MKLFNYLFKKVILKNFFKIDLSNVEREIAEDSVKKKYSKTLIRSIISGLFLIPAVLFLDTSILISVLIPITMVAGTAWFAISLANVRQKFEQFGLELTTNMFEAFVTSLVMLGLLTLFSLIPSVFSEISVLGQQYFIVKLASGILGILVVFKLLYNLFAGSLKYDINDAMLTGQSEAAEKFFRKSLSLLYTSAAVLREGKGLEVANYHIGLAFHEIFAFIKSAKVSNSNLDELMDAARKLKRNPAMPQKEADKIAMNLIDNFIFSCKNVEGERVQKSFNNIREELNCLKNNKKEPQTVVDTRLATIFEEIAELLDLQGESLFKEK